MESGLFMGLFMSCRFSTMHYDAASHQALSQV